MTTITSTVVEIVSTSQEYNIPGDVTPEQFVASYGANVPGLASMVSEISCDGGVKHIAFKPRTGTKG